MSSPITAVNPPGVPSVDQDARTEKLKQAAHDFESLLVRQFLKASKVGGDAKGGYGDMAVDALADGIERAGGLGLAQRIQDALRGEPTEGRGDERF